MTKDEALKLALEALEKLTKYFNIVRLGESRLKDTEIRGASHKAMAAIQEALAQPEQEPVGFAVMERPWVGLTEEDKQIAFDDTQEGGGFWEFADAIEAKLKEKNT